MASPDDAMQTMIANLPEKTGKSLEGWLAVVGASGLAKHGEILKHLKEAHGLTHGYANLVTHFHLNPPESAPAGDDLLEALYAGPKAGLRPIHDMLTAYLATLGADVDFAPKKSYVSVRRSKQFAILQPSTKDRFDLGINLKGMAPDGKLEASGSFNAMVSHRVRLASVADVDAAVKGWLKAAYDAA